LYISGYYTSNLTLYNQNDTTTSSFKAFTNPSVQTHTFIAKYNSNGTGIWATRIASTTQVFSYIPVDIILDSEQNVYISGYYSGNVNLIFYHSNNTTFKLFTNAGGSDIFISKYNRDGSGQWVTRIAGSDNERPQNMLLDLSNNLYISGYFASSGSGLTLYNSDNNVFKTIPYGGNSITFIAKYNSSGIGQWVTRIANAVIARTVNMTLDSVNNIYILGYYYLNSNLVFYNSNDATFRTYTGVGGNYDIFVVKYNRDGLGQWATRISSNNDDTPVNLILDSENNVYISGYYQSTELILFNEYDTGTSTFKTLTNATVSAYIAKYNKNGLGQWATQIIGKSIPNSSTIGQTWVQKPAAGNKIWMSVAMSSDGQYQTAVVVNNYIYTSTNAGNNWVQKTFDTTRSWYYVAMSSDGQYQTAVVNNGYIYTSNNRGNSWIENTSAGTRQWRAVAISSTGLYQTALAFDDYVYISSNTGNNWVRKTPIGIQKGAAA
ncbi:MAG: hypothetical protein EBU01_13860, partial [Crocinitomicaceae bacterium]|nr:hypothetical protein [Crocinitomicaceae bacterium]